MGVKQRYDQISAQCGDVLVQPDADNGWEPDLLSQLDASVNAACRGR